MLHVPQTLDELIDSMQLLEKVLNEQDEIQGRFIPLEEQFAILDKCEVTYSPEVASRRANLATDWAYFQEAIVAAEEMIRKSKEKFKAELLMESDQLKKRIAAILSDLQNNGPHAMAIRPDDALATCDDFREQLASALEREAVLRQGLALFKIEQPPCKETMLIQKASIPLQQIFLDG